MQYIVRQMSFFTHTLSTFRILAFFRDLVGRATTTIFVPTFTSGVFFIAVLMILALKRSLQDAHSRRLHRCLSNLHRDVLVHCPGLDVRLELRVVTCVAGCVFVFSRMDVIDMC